MNDVNLIPEDYLSYLKLRRVLRKFLIMFVSLVAFIIAGKVVLVKKIESESKRTAALKYSERKILKKRERVEELNKSRVELKKRLKLLDSLRGGPEAGKMFIAVDKAINKDVWLTEWKFFRTGEFSGKTAAVEKRGYFVVVPRHDAKKEQEFKNFTRMDIKGRALKYSAMAEFIKGLLKREEIKDVFVKKTGKLRHGPEQFIEYELSILINT